jgi:aldehyde dehydrogenase (NAD+)
VTALAQQLNVSALGSPFGTALRRSNDDASTAGCAQALRTAYNAGRTRPLAWRAAQLQAVDTMLKVHETRFVQALKADLGKGDAESLSTEIAFVRAEVRHMLAKLPAWTAREKVSTPWLVKPGRSTIVREPLGVVLVIGAWNMPVPVLLGPVVAAIAAGNAVVMKPSELAPATSALMAELIPQHLDRDCFQVVEGGVAETTALLEQRWDHIFYTGNGTIGRIVAAAAARHLTPVTLELGGKSPAYVHSDCDMLVTARRLAWAKFMNVGQVCVSPDHVLVHQAVAQPLADALVRALREFYGDNPKTSADYGRVVNTRHFDRLAGLLADHGGQVLHGGRHDRDQLFIEPTIVRSPRDDSPLMQTEIFGPILPLLTVASVDEAIQRINAGAKPLTLSVFSQSSAVVDRFESETSSGALVSNDAIVNHRVHALPFSGVGDSGYGAYHGRAGFETFSHRKAVMRRPTWLDTALRYPPYTPARLKAMRRLIGI